MKVMLAAAEDVNVAHCGTMVGHKNFLFSYFYQQKSSEEKKRLLFDELNRNQCETICDSGLFTMMFGSGKGGNHDFNFMNEYAKKYISAAQKYNLNQLSIVECDVHKILGMTAVYELRKQFENSGMNVIYVWHREEGLDGLFRMAEKYDYIALSVPELRILFKQVDSRYQDGVKDLVSKIKQNVGKLPKIHLLGNTVHETMETPLAYSCDSTSWKSGVRYGRGMYFNGRHVKNESIRDIKYLGFLEQFKITFPAYNDLIIKTFKTASSQNSWRILATSAWAYKRYQDWLDRNLQWVGTDANKR
jgi:hypothetical protein